MTTRDYSILDPERRTRDQRERLGELRDETIRRLLWLPELEYVSEETRREVLADIGRIAG